MKDLRGDRRIFLDQPTAGPPGRRLAVKDLFDTDGLRTTYGSAIFAEHLPDRTATAVELLEQDGYVTVGKTNLHEFAYGITSQNPWFGTVPNPAAPGRVAGGSSGGSAAALAAGLADLALGTDSGGSIRIPAAWCGVTGYKPSHGLVSLDRCFPLAPSFDHAGPMGRSVGECAAAMRALAPDAAPVRLDSLGEVTVGLAWTDLADPLVGLRVSEAAGLWPAAQPPVTRTSAPPADFPPNARPIAFPLPDPATQWVFMREVADVHRDLFGARAAEYGENVATKLTRCLAVTDAQYQTGLQARTAYEREALAALGTLDLLMTPTVGFVAPPLDVDELEIRARAIQFTIPFNLLGWPALSLPCGLAEGGLPCALQLVGRPGQDALVLAAGALLEDAMRGRRR